MPHTFLVTGANRGIGLELARQLAARGERVIATARDPEKARELRQLDTRVEALDVADEASVRAFAGRLEGQPVDVLVNNAGVGVGRGELGALDMDELRRCFEVNTLGALRVTQALLENVRAGERKVVANVTSKMGSIADNTSGGSYAYRASKCALNMVTKSLSVDLARDGVTCVVLHPGWVKTDMGGSSAPLSVEESARGLLEVIDGLTPEKTGEFFDYSGETIPW